MRVPTAKVLGFYAYHALVGGGVVCAFAACQHLLVLQVRPTPRMFLIPSLVGILSSLLIAHVRRLRMEIDRLNHSLESLVARRTSQWEESELRAERIVEAVSDGLIGLDGDLRIRTFNPAAERITGFPAAQAIDRRVGELPCLDAGEGLEASLARVRAGGRSESFELTCRGGEAVIDVTVNPGASGCSLEVILDVRDVTERRAAERREAELRAQLLQAQKMELAGRLASGVAHDFNNFLTPILGFAELGAAENPEGSAARANYEEIREAALKAARVAAQLLLFVRQHPERRAPLALNGLLQSSAKLLRRVVGDAVRVELRLDEALPTIVADAVQLEQLILNLAVNARDAMTEGGDLILATGALELDAAAAGARGVAPGRYVSLAVRDTGHGMAPDVVARAFEPFFTTKDPTQGTGLGLSVVHSIAHAHGGAVDVDSAPGQGTTFRILFPVGIGVPESCAAVLEPPRGGSERILVVDDSPEIRRLVIAVLRPLGYQCAEASGVAEAQGCPGRIDLLITDQSMPDGSGVELARRLRVDRPGLPVLFLSGLPAASALAEAGQGPGVDFLPKPAPVRVLGHRVRALLDGRAGGTAAGSSGP